MVRTTRARGPDVTLVPLRTVLASPWKKLLGLVAQNIASWNQLAGWLREIAALREAA
jgi:hypothetical protein